MGLCHSAVELVITDTGHDFLIDELGMVAKGTVVFKKYSRIGSRKFWFLIIPMGNEEVILW